MTKIVAVKEEERVRKRSESIARADAAYLVREQARNLERAQRKMREAKAELDRLKGLPSAVEKKR